MRSLEHFEAKKKMCLLQEEPLAFKERRLRTLRSFSVFEFTDYAFEADCLHSSFGYSSTKGELVSVKFSTVLLRSAWVTSCITTTFDWTTGFYIWKLCANDFGFGWHTGVGGSYTLLRSFAAHKLLLAYSVTLLERWPLQIYVWNSVWSLSQRFEQVWWTH